MKNYPVLLSLMGFFSVTGLAQLGYEEYTHTCDDLSVARSAEFVQCNTRTQTQCFGEPIIQQVGQNMMLDARLQFVNGGASMHNQKVQLLKVTKQLQTGTGSSLTVMYACSNREQEVNSLCPNASDDSVIVHQRSPDKFDIDLIVESTEAGSFIYTVTYEVVNPRTGGIEELDKVFQVQVEDQPDVDYLGNQGHQATLSCLAPPGVQEVEAIDWKQDGRVLSIGGSKYRMVANRLVINKIQPDDEGVYSCVVTDERNMQTEVEILCLYLAAVCLGVYFCLRACRQALITRVHVETPECESDTGKCGPSVLVVGCKFTKQTFHRQQ